MSELRAPPGGMSARSRVGSLCYESAGACMKPFGAVGFYVPLIAPSFDAIGMPWENMVINNYFGISWNHMALNGVLPQISRVIFFNTEKLIVIGQYLPTTCSAFDRKSKIPIKSQKKSPFRNNFKDRIN